MVDLPNPACVGRTQPPIHWYAREVKLLNAGNTVAAKTHVSNPAATSAAVASKGPLTRVEDYLWRKWRLFEVTFALYMVEPWEKVVILTFAASVTLLLLFSTYYYLPSHIKLVLRRAVYYLFDVDTDSPSSFLSKSSSSSSAATPPTAEGFAASLLALLGAPARALVHPRATARALFPSSSSAFAATAAATATAATT